MSKVTEERGRHHCGARAERNTRSMRTTRLRDARNKTISTLFDDSKSEKKSASTNVRSIPVV